MVYNATGIQTPLLSKRHDSRANEPGTRACVRFSAKNSFELQFFARLRKVDRFLP